MSMCPHYSTCPNPRDKCGIDIIKLNEQNEKLAVRTWWEWFEQSCVANRLIEEGLSELVIKGISQMAIHSAPPHPGTEDLPWIECEVCRTHKREELMQCKVCYKSICKECDKATPETGPVCAACDEKSSPLT